MPLIFYRISGYMLFAGFGWLAYDAFQRKDSLDIKVFFSLFILYNPLISFPFPHIVWLIINAIVIIGMILNILFAEENPYEDSTKKR
ncbi:MAG: hypothetical protein DI529_11245 [Chryseobacterium sp.]|nr:MAG: hypothetical protein DI529_11245 [Chryseobacterium sp.]